MDCTFNQVNQMSLPVAPFHAMNFGNTLQQFCQYLVYANLTHGPPLLAKVDLSDGYYRAPLTPEVALELAVVLLHDQTELPLVGTPLSLPSPCISVPSWRQRQI